jgi:hypothetical protein
MLGVAGLILGPVTLTAVRLGVWRQQMERAVQPLGDTNSVAHPTAAQP